MFFLLNVDEAFICLLVLCGGVYVYDFHSMLFDYFPNDRLFFDI